MIPEALLLSWTDDNDNNIGMLESFKEGITISIPVAVPSLGVTENATGLAIIPAWITTHTSAAMPSVVENVEF